MVPDSVSLAIDGCSSGQSVATWGQRAMWSIVQYLGEDDPYFNGCRRVQVPAGCDMPRVLEAITAALRDNPTLRTVFRMTEGRLGQTVQGSGAVTVEVHQVPAGQAQGAAVDALASELAGRALPMDEWPASFGVLAEGDEPRFVVFAFSHLALDHSAAIMVAQALEDLLAGRRPPGPRQDPLTLAAWEQSPAGQATTAAAERFWSRALARGPVSLFDYPVRTPAEPRFRQLVMRSPAVTEAARAAAARLRVSTSAVLLAAQATVLARYTGHDEVLIQPVSANRDDPVRRDLVGTLTWDGLAVVGTGGHSFCQIAKNAFRAGLSAYRFGYYDPEAGWRLRAEQQFLRGAFLDLGAHFNDIRDEEPASGPVAAASADPVPASTLAEGGGWPRMDARYFFAAGMQGRATRLSLICDTCYVSLEDMVRHLRGIERLVIAAADDDVDAERIDEVTGVAPVTRGEGWVRCGDGWADLAAVGRLWRQVTGDQRSAVFCQPAPESGLVGYAAGSGPPLADLHAALLAAFGERTDARAPERYVRCDQAPGDTASLAAWQHMTVLESATGREGGPARLVSTDPADRGRARAVPGSIR